MDKANSPVLANGLPVPSLRLATWKSRRIPRPSATIILLVEMSLIDAAHITQ